jgi:hypothetical protein
MQNLFFRMGIVVALFSIGCNLSATPAASSTASSGGPLSKFLDPQTDAVLPLAAQKILVQADDAHGVARAEFSVNGKLVSTQESSDPQKKSVTFAFAWEPPAAGNYLLQARAQNSLGAWGQDTIISVRVEKKRDSGESATEKPPTAKVEATANPPAATTQAPPTITPSATFTATSQQVTITADVSPKIFYKLGSGCSPTDLVLKANTTGNVFSVVVFLKLFDHDTGSAISDYDHGTAMTPKGGGVFAWTINSSKFPPALPYTSAWAGYQFAATNNSGDVILRSPTFTDVVLNTSC